MDFDLRVKVATYGITAERGMPPSLHDVARATGSAPDDVRDAFARLMQKRLLVLEPDGATIRMAPPFSGVPTQHRVQAGGVAYYANCAWDALGIPAALGKDQLWRLSVTWYATRLQPDSRRPAPSEMRGIFERIGLFGDFWDPKADTFA